MENEVEWVSRHHSMASERGPGSSGAHYGHSWHFMFTGSGYMYRASSLFLTVLSLCHTVLLLFQGQLSRLSDSRAVLGQPGPWAEILCFLTTRFTEKLSPSGFWTAITKSQVKLKAGLAVLEK